MVAMLSIGYRALRFSADEAIDERGAQGGGAGPFGPGEEGGGRRQPGHGRGPGPGSSSGPGALLLAASGADPFCGRLLPALSGRLAFNIVDGVIRVLVFVLYVLGIGMMGEIRRIFQYHGAEHKAVHAYERKAQARPRKASRGFRACTPGAGQASCSS